jgi:TonB-linked SusC/RagA family outer membrane protein
MAESTGILEYRIPGIDGLTAKAMLSYDFGIRDSKEFQKEYDQYRYDEASNTYNRYTRQSPQSIRRESYMESHLLSHVSLKYKHTFVDVHKVEGLLAWETNRYDADNFSAKRNLALPLPYLFAGVAEEQLATMNTGGLYINANNALLGRIQYGYADRYLIDALFRYDGSSKFAPGKQWGFFPGVSAGWRISEEAFFKESPLAFIQQLKLRASYGITGDDSASSYQFISGYNYPSGTDRRNFTGGYVFGGNFVASADNKGIPNPAITWYTAKMFNAGIDFDAWGKFGLTVEYFNRDRSGLLATRNGGIPTVVGASLPQENLNGDRTFGMELDLYYRDHVGDFTYKIEGIAQITRTKRLYVERGAIGSSWSNWKNNQNNRLQGVHNGYQGAGRFESWEQIWSHPVYTGRSTLIGDYIYEDWNGDGQIDGNDSHPIRFNQYPWTNFSLIFNGTYKSFDFDMLWQGATMTSLIYGEQLREPLWGSGESSAMAQFMDRWHLVDPKADPYDPTQQWVSGYFANTGTLPDENSTFNAEDGTYLRLKSVEVGYTLPRFLGINELRIFANAYNLLTFTKIRYVDPEHPNDTYGYLYPLNKSYTLGLNIRF